MRRENPYRNIRNSGQNKYGPRLGGTSQLKSKKTAKNPSIEPKKIARSSNNPENELSFTIAA